MPDSENSTETATVSCLAALTEDQRADFWATLALRYTAGVGCRTAKRLFEVYGSAYAAMQDIGGWSHKASIADRIVQAVRSNRWRDLALKEWEHAGRVNCSVLLWSDSRYPELLREIPDPPLLLYCKGDVSLLSNPSIGVVGSRKCSQDGVHTTQELCKTLSASGVTTVSGLARGIDSVAHRHALSGWGQTVAVLGTGISHVYPPENESLFYDIASSGLIVTEFAPNATPEGRNFPMRNRIISGLSLGVLVVEATPKSGSLITARHALEQGREVFAVPGRVQAKTSSGCHELIRQGATAVFSCDDILVSIAPLLGISMEVLQQSHIEDPRVSIPEAIKITPPELPVSSHEKTDDNCQVSNEPQDVEDIIIVKNIKSAKNQDAEVLPEGNTVSSYPECDESKSGAPAIDLDEILRNIPEVIEIPKAEGETPNGIETEGEPVIASSSEQIELNPDDPLDKNIVLLLKAQKQVHIDVLSRELGVDISKVSTALLMLEVTGSVQQLPGMHYRLATS